MEGSARAAHLGRYLLVGACCAALVGTGVVAWQTFTLRVFVPDEPVQMESFADLFSGTAWIDTARTTLSHDPIITAFTDMPKVTVNTISASNFEASSRAFHERNSCIGGRCLVADSSELTLDGSPITLPHLGDAIITDIVASVIEDRWLVGIVTVWEGVYELHAYWFDGASFISALGHSGARILESRYPGYAAFAGTARHWLAIWSAYEGTLVEVRDGAAYDRSPLVGIRAMRGGYAPLLFHDAPRGAWYLWSEGAEAPSFIQFVRDARGFVSGARDLTALIAAGGRRLRLAPAVEEVDDGPRFVAAMERELFPGGSSEPHFVAVNVVPITYKDDYQVVSVNLMPESRIWRARLAPLGNVLPGNGVRYSLSVDGATWRTVVPEEWASFDGRESRGLWWRVEVRGGAPVFLDGMHLDFEVGQGG